ncbi:MAG: hypothetical protein WD229_05310 [Pirellulales bacterium]
MMVQSTVRIPAGQAVVVGGIETRSTAHGESGQAVILVTARVSEDTADKPDDAAVGSQP